MKGKILIGGIIALAIAFSCNLSNVKPAHAETYPINQFSCTTVTYNAFGNCINGVQSRDVIDKTAR